MLSWHSFSGLDGELVVGDPNSPTCMQDTTSGVMKKTGTPDFTFWVFDDFLAEDSTFGTGFAVRLDHAMKRVNAPGVSPRLKIVPHIMIHNEDELKAYESAMLAEGYEGVMIRDPLGPYKHGRSTAKEGWLLKIKRFTDSEAVVIGVEEEMHNTNEAKKDALGHTERSTSMAGMVGKGTLGALRCRTPAGVEFNIGSGFTAAQRKELFAYRGAELVGKHVTYKHFAGTGVKDAPRFPVFKAFRDPSDM